jgi:ADP-ribose pyrophosphatase YjhB (NUDIX family)
MSAPAGFVSYGEEIGAAARRDFEDETGLVADVGAAVQVASNFHDRRG